MVSCLAMSSSAAIALLPPSASTISNVALRCVYALSWRRITFSKAYHHQPPALIRRLPQYGTRCGATTRGCARDQGWRVRGQSFQFGASGLRFEELGCEELGFEEIRV
eukprot:2755211-Rhodomonas_salina.1